MNKEKIHIDNNPYIYCDDKSHRVKICSLHLSRTTRFQARYVEAIPSVSETTLATQLGN